MFEQLQNMKRDVVNKMTNQKYSEGIVQMNKCLSLSRQFYQEDHPFNIELLCAVAECYLNLSNLEINTKIKY